MKSDLDVVIVAYGNASTIAACVECAKRIDGLGDVIVVDHGADGSGRIAEARGATAISDPTNRGFGAGQNNGVGRVDSPFVLLLNPDAEIDADGVEQGLALLHERADVAMVQGVILDGDTGVPDRSQGRELGPLDLIGRALGLKRLLRFSAVQRLVTRGSLRDHVARIPDGPTEVASLAATAVLVRRTAFEAVGGFDESYFLYGEDLDLCRRLRAAGWRLVALPVVWARHRNGFSCGNWVTRELHWWRGTLMFAARWWGRRRWTLAMPAAAAMLVRIAIVAPREAVDAYRALITDPRAARRTARH